MRIIVVAVKRIAYLLGSFAWIRLLGWAWLIIEHEGTLSFCLWKIVIVMIVCILISYHLAIVFGWSFRLITHFLLYTWITIVIGSSAITRKLFILTIASFSINASSFILTLNRFYLFVELFVAVIRSMLVTSFSLIHLTCWSILFQ